MNHFELETLLYLAGNGFRIYVIYRFFRIFFERRKVGGSLTFLCFFGYFLLNSGMFLLFRQPFLNLATSLIPCFLLTYLYEGRLRLRVIAVAFITIVDLVCEEIVYWLLIAVTGSNHLVAGIILPNLLMLPFVVVFRKLKALKNGDRVSLWETVCTLSVPIISMFILTIVLFEASDSRLAVIAIAGLLLINVVIFYLFDLIAASCQREYERALEQEVAQRQKEAQQNELRLRKELDDRLRLFRHDMNNHLIVLGEMAASERLEEIRKYLIDMGEEVEPAQLMIQSGNFAVDSIVNLKLREAERLGVEVHQEMNLPETLAVSEFDLNIILGNLLDNALRALESASVRKLSLKVRYDRELLFIGISNTYGGRIVEEEGHLQTTKDAGEEHGLGLESVRKAVGKYQGELEFHYDNTCFTVTALLYPREVEPQNTN